MVRLLCCSWLFLALTASAHAQDRPADNATAARIADGVEKARAGKVLDAIEQFQRVLDTAGDELVPVDRSWYTPARWVVHGQIARLPADGVRLYRQRVDGQAAKRLVEAKTARGDDKLNRLLADMCCARACEEAILELARRAFERADFDAAERYWQMLLPPTADDDRLVHFPDPKTPAAAVRAHLLLVKLFRGERDDAKRELQSLREKFPAAAGLLAGRTGKYVDTLAALVDHPDETTLPPPPDEPGWPTFAGFDGRRGTSRAKLPYFWPDQPTWQKPLPFRRGGRFDGPGPDGRHPRALAFFPVIGGGQVVVGDGARVASFDAMTGKWDEKGTGPDGGEESPVPVRHGERFTLTEADGVLYARVGPAELQAGGRKSFLVALGPPNATNDRPELWRLNPPATDGTFTAFEGPPAVRSGHLYAAFWRHLGAEAQAGVACFRIDDPKAAPELVWQRTVGRAGSGPNGETRYRHNLVTLAGPNVVYGTDGGTVIALDAATGRPAWEYRYPRNERPTLPRYRDLCPPLADGGRVYAAPADADRLLCLDAATGRLIWEREGVEVTHLLGVARGRLIATFAGGTRGIRGLNLWTGAASGSNGWTVHDDGGEGTFGRGLVTEDVVVWPTRHGLRFLDPSDGTQLRSPISGPGPKAAGGLDLPTQEGHPFGNLCYADGVLVVTTATEIWGFVSEAKKLGDRRDAIRDDPADPAKHADLARSLIDAGRYAEAEAEVAKAGDTQYRLRWLLAERLIRDGKRDEAKRLYEDMAKGEGSFAAAGAARLAEMVKEPDRRREAWRRVFAKTGTVRDKDGVPWPANRYAEIRFGDLLAMHGTGVREDDFVGLVGDDRNPKESGPPVFVRSSTPDDQPARLRGVNSPPAYRADQPILSELARPAIPSTSGTDGPPSLEPVSGDGFGYCFVYDRRLFVRTFPVDGIAAVIASPSSRTAGLYPCVATSETINLVQTTDGHMLFQDRAAKTLREVPWTPKPWPEPPVPVGDGRFLIPDDGSVVLFDARAGKELARYAIPGADSLTGALPRFRVNRGDVLVVIDRNYGIEVDRLRIDGLKRTWSGSPVLVGRTMDDVATAEDRFFTAADGMLAAHGWNDGNPLWEVPLPEGRWKLAVAARGILAYPTEAVIRRSDFDAVGAFRRAGWDAGALLRAAGRTYDVWADREWPVLVFDPADGRLLKRRTIAAAGH